MQLLTWLQVRNSTVDDLRVLLCAAAVPLFDLSLGKLIDACASSGCHNGLYFFFDGPDEGDILYIGSAASRSLIERIPAHFDLRKDAYMNGVLRALVQNDAFIDDALLLDGWRARGSTVRVAALGIEGPPYEPRPPHKEYSGDLRALERKLQQALRPRGNNFRATKISGGTIVRALIKPRTRWFG